MLRHGVAEGTAFPIRVKRKKFRFLFAGKTYEKRRFKRISSEFSVLVLCVCVCIVETAVGRAANVRRELTVFTDCGDPEVRSATARAGRKPNACAAVAEDANRRCESTCIKIIRVYTSAITITIIIVTTTRFF